MSRYGNPIGVLESIHLGGRVALLILSFGLAGDLTRAQDTKGTMTIEVVDTDSRQPVRSLIATFPPESGQDRGETDSEGRLSVDMDCSRATSVQAQPIGSAYHYSRKVPCTGSPKHMVLHVSAVVVASTLQNNLALAEKAQNWAVAAHIANELSWMGSGAGGRVVGTDAERLALVYARRALGAADDVVFDTSQGKYVMTSGLRAEIESFQRGYGITVSGHLNYATVHYMSGMTSGSLRHELLDSRSLTVER